MTVSRIAIYSIKEFMDAAKLREETYQAARRGGLQVLTFGRKRYIHGAHWEEFLLKKSGVKEPINT